jgi:hypothetical protein
MTVTRAHKKQILTGENDILANRPRQLIGIVAEGRRDPRRIPVAFRAREPVSFVAIKISTVTLGGETLCAPRVRFQLDGLIPNSCLRADRLRQGEDRMSLERPRAEIYRRY